MKKIKSLKKGFTLFETMLTIAVAAIIMIGVFIIYEKVSTHIKIKRQIEAIIYIKNEVTHLYSSKNNYEGLYFQTGSPDFIRGISKEMAELKLFTPVFVMAEAINGQMNTGFMTSVEKEECIKIISSLPYANFISIRVNNTSVYNKMKNTTGNVEFDIANAVRQCSSNDKNSIALDNV